MRYFYVYLAPCLNVYALEPGLPLLVRGMRFDSLVPVEAWEVFYRDRIAAEGRIPLKPGPAAHKSVINPRGYRPSIRYNVTTLTSLFAHA